MVNSIIHSVSVLTPPTQCTSLMTTIVCQCTLEVDSSSIVLVQKREEGDLNDPEKVTVDNTTEALYVCDSSNNRVVVY